MFEYDFFLPGPGMVAKMLVSKALIYTNRADARNTVRAELRTAGLKADDVVNVSSAKEAIEQLEKVEGCLLILDWDIGPDKILEILQANRGAHRLEARPCLIFTTKLDDHISSVAKEYSVSLVHTGEVTPESIKELVKELIRETNNLTPIRRVLLEVEKRRAEDKLGEAEAILIKILEKDPENDRLKMELAEIYTELDKWTEALALLEPLKDAEPPQARALHLLARCYLKQNQNEHAINALKRAQFVSPYNIERLAEMGDLFLDLERPKDARNAFEKILDFAPESKQGKLGKSTALLAMGELNEALHILKSSASSRELASVFNTTAILAIRQNKHESGMELYKTAANLINNNDRILARLFFNMGIGLAKWGKVPEAITAFEESAKLDPEFLPARKNAEILQKGKSRTAKKAAGAPSDPTQDEVVYASEVGTMSFNVNFDVQEDDE